MCIYGAPFLKWRRGAVSVVLLLHCRKFAHDRHVKRGRSFIWIVLRGTEMGNSCCVPKLISQLPFSVGLDLATECDGRSISLYSSRA
jgi:hypothetical protein